MADGGRAAALTASGTIGSAAAALEPSTEAAAVLVPSVDSRMKWL